MSVGSLIERDVATIWRGPIITKVIQEFLADVDWGSSTRFWWTCRRAPATPS